MKHLMYICSLLAITLMVSNEAFAQANTLKYRRNAMADLLVYHPEDEFGYNIYEAFDALPVPDKYDDHSIDGFAVIDNSTVMGVQRKDTGYYKATYGHQLTAIELEKNARYTEKLLNSSGMAREMVAKWFGLHQDADSNWVFSTQLVAERGQYNANDIDIAVALQTTRGLATLSDAGEELISQTYVLVNDVTYVTSEQEAEVAKKTMNVLGSIFDGLFGGDTGKKTAQLAGDIADSFTGFKVKTHSYLYQLQWNDSIAGLFYYHYYTEKPDPAKIQAFMQNDSLFRFKYVAHEYEFDKQAVLKGKYTREELVKTICARSMDKNIVALGKQYEDFKVKTPVYEVLSDDKGTIKGYAAKIGMKEGITEASSFQVVQRYIDPKSNKTGYKYVATVKPQKGKIWDNRYNAVLEQAEGATLPYTTFKKTAGGEILPGMLIIEGKYRKVEQ